MASSCVTVHVASPGYIRTNLSISALTGDGEAHGQMDETTVSCRRRIRKEISSCSHPCGYFLVCSIRLDRRTVPIQTMLRSTYLTVWQMGRQTSF